LNGIPYTLSKAGTAFIFSADGTAQGPVTWDGTIINTGGDAAFPLFGWIFPGEPTDNGLPNVNIRTIDQLNAIIQHSLTPPPPAAKPVSD
jgi:hypothetical protein